MNIQSGEGMPGSKGLESEAWQPRWILSHQTHGLKVKSSRSANLITATTLRAYTFKDLAQMAKKRGVRGWHSMRKDQLVDALVQQARTKTARHAKNRSTEKTKSDNRTNPRRVANGTSKKIPSAPKNPRVQKRIQKLAAKQEQRKNLSLFNCKMATQRSGSPVKDDRIALMVRDAYWLHAYWEITRLSVDRAKAVMAEQWHSAEPVLRLYEVDKGSTTKSAERHLRDIEIHSGVNNWYMDVENPPNSFRVEIGYLATNGRFYALVRSNSVETPIPGSKMAIDRNWSDVAEDCDQIYAQSGGFEKNGSGRELRKLFEERLRRPMGSPMETRYGAGAERILNLEQEFKFEVDSELVIFGSASENAYVTLSGEPVKLGPDGTFTVRIKLEDKRYVVPVVANSANGLEQRTTVVAVERNTKTMEPIIREPNE